MSIKERHSKCSQLFWCEKMIRPAMKKPVENDELIDKLRQAAGRSIKPEEKREQRISYILSAVGRFDEKTRKEVEAVVDGVD